MVCGEHREDGMIDLKSKVCGQSGCSKRCSYGFPSAERIKEFCLRHAKNGMINLQAKRMCISAGCPVTANYGFERKYTHCRKHAEDGMNGRCGLHSPCISDCAGG